MAKIKILKTSKGTFFSQDGYLWFKVNTKTAHILPFEMKKGSQVSVTTFQYVGQEVFDDQMNKIGIRKLEGGEES
ncbi:hypothetical protein [Weissella cibaria]|nr:hypothetical protein [Weissella cibaria]